MKLSIIIPVFNEEKTIYQLLEKVNSVDYRIDNEIIIVNDGSTDGTLEKTLKARKEFENLKIISYPKNKGKGFAIRQGIKKIDGDIVIIQDADLEYDPSQIPFLLQPILNNQCKVVYGSRFLGEFKNMSFFFYFGNRLLTFITNFLFGSNLTDIETCYKLICKDILKDLYLNSNTFEIESEITAKLLKNKIFIKELPIKYFARKKKEGKKIRWIDGIKNIKILLQVKFFKT